MEIWWGQFSRESFGKLRVLEIVACHDISLVIPHNIEQLIVRSCLFSGKGNPSGRSCG